MATTWPKERRLIGTKISRLDGPEKATGRAKYSYDRSRPGLLHAVILRSKYAHAKIKSLDTTAAEKAPGFKALHAVQKPGDELYYAGAEILGIACDTEAHALDALHLVKIEYEPLDHVVQEEDAMTNFRKKADKQTMPAVGKFGKVNVVDAAEETQGKVADGFAKAVKTIEGLYGMPVICHHCLESHGMVAEFGADGKSLTVWCSTQAVAGTAGALAKPFNVAATQVQCVTEYMGGGFGSKFGPDIQGFICCNLAQKAKAPVKLMLDRADEATCAGNRPSLFAKVKIGADKDGTITAFEAESWGTSPGAAIPYVYPVANYKRTNNLVRLNTGALRAFRAPGHPQYCAITEAAVDDLAAAMGIDPLVIRSKNVPQNAGGAPISWNAMRGDIYKKELDAIVEMSKWKEKWHPPGQSKGVVKHGIGMALHTWTGQAQGQPNDCTVIIDSAGTVTAQTSTQDLGTGQRTVTAIVVAEILGMEVGDIVLQFGQSQLGRSTGSGGSTTCPSQAPAALRAATAARDDLFAKVADKLKLTKEDLAIEKGKVVDTKAKKSWAWKEFCSKLGTESVKQQGTWIQGDTKDNPGVSNAQVGGVQVAEVMVDTETGVVRCTKFYAVQDCGMIINLLGCESQVAGGVIMGLNYALFEERIMDRVTGRQVNPDMEFYRLGCIEDMPQIMVKMIDMPERGVIGIGEPPTVSTAAAIGNAVFNAIGVRVPFAPYTPERVLEALAKGGKA